MYLFQYIAMVVITVSPWGNNVIIHERKSYLGYFVKIDRLKLVLSYFNL